MMKDYHFIKEKSNYFLYKYQTNVGFWLQFINIREAMEKNLPYEIKCPSLLICGTKDHAGSCIRYNREWHRKTKIPLKWIEGAGHNSNTDKPEMINSLIEEFLSNI